MPVDDPAPSFWQFDDPYGFPTAIFISGPICRTIQSGQAERIDVLFECTHYAI